MPATAGGAPNNRSSAARHSRAASMAARLIADHVMILANPRGPSASSSNSPGSGSFKPEDAGATPAGAATFFPRPRTNQQSRLPVEQEIAGAAPVGRATLPVGP